MRTNYDFAPLRRSAIGFDRLFDLLENAGQAAENYPPFDLEKLDEDSYRITVAVAGFRSDEIEITAQQNQLLVSGRRSGNDEGQYIHRGIATRAFERRFALGDYVQVRGADLRDGLLSIELVREIPEAMKPRKVAIGGAQPQTTIEGQSSENDNHGDVRAA
ncbi:Hsp20 family protein [Sphingosinicella sp. BN140058]|uniref:Hsp20 family protein n=1 Tax=Sphingosinicella sp. BN140058 TaxID=1892855 RepID=UPI00101337F4|nr:Hsp20 family protein [Sphingosinicella sp. BN140058]QAY76739.1 Hsp20 family protein [Sphingosinicella sp. BN140058]